MMPQDRRANQRNQTRAQGWHRRLICLGAIFALTPPLSGQGVGGPDWKAVDAAIGRAGAMQPGGVYKVGLPRSDLHVTIDGIAIKPTLALGSWVAFLPMTSHRAMPMYPGRSADARVMVMGDLVLTEDEIGPVMTVLQAGGIEQTAVHHHVLHETPRLFYMHIGATGNPVTIAHTIHTALATTGTPLTAPPAAAPSPPAAFDLDTTAIRTALGYGGKVNGGVYQVSVPRARPIQEDGMEIPPAMGTATALNFQPTGGGKAAITGDFVLTAAEVNPVIRALTDHGIAVTALHNHMLTEQPRLFFMHFWANADAATLAKGLRVALDHTASQPRK